MLTKLVEESFAQSRHYPDHFEKAKAGVGEATKVTKKETG